MGETLPEARLQRSDLVEKSLREARTLGMVDQTPQGSLVGLEADGQLIELVLETMGVRRPRGLGARETIAGKQHCCHESGRSDRDRLSGPGSGEPPWRL